MTTTTTTDHGDDDTPPPTEEDKDTSEEEEEEEPSDPPTEEEKEADEVEEDMSIPVNVGPRPTDRTKMYYWRRRARQARLLEQARQLANPRVDRLFLAHYTPTTPPTGAPQGPPQQVLPQGTAGPIRRRPRRPALSARAARDSR